MSHLRRAYIGLGSNLGEPLLQIGAAWRQLSKLPQTQRVALSQCYQSRPWGDPDQPDYINAVAALDTALPPHELLTELLAIELRQGRERLAGRRNGPRTLDLDLLMYGDEVLHSAGLELPHPRISERPFVLLPLAEIAPGIVIPGIGPISSLLRTDFASLCWPLKHGAVAP